MIMVSIVTKNIKGIDYLYLVESIRQDARVVQKTVKYIGKKRPIFAEEFESMKFSHSKKDWVLNSFNEELSYQEHTAMKEASKAYNEYFNSLDIVSREKNREKFLSEFISNSNAIEGSTLTSKDTFNFLFNDIAPKEGTKKELYMASNLLKAWEYVEKHCKFFPSEENIKELHRLVNQNIESDETLGSYKTVQNYIGDVYTTSYIFVTERMHELMLWIKKAFNELDDFEVAFQSHAEFEIIHPFVDGNGRVGRLLVNWLLLHKGLMPIAIRYKNRSDYISSLNNARKGSLNPICKFCFSEYLARYRVI